jgi:mannan endo-1,4-beta-mannosidase
VKFIRIPIIGVAIIVAAVVIVIAIRHDKSAVGKSSAPAAMKPIALPTTPGTYLGVYGSGVPDSYAGVKAFTTATGVMPRVLVYYSGWLEPFRASFATAAASRGAVPLVQIEPTRVSLAAIASGQYDRYLSAYAEAVRTYRRAVILSFGHEMNGFWYSWGYRHASPAVFVAAWRHIVSVFHAAGVNNVTWLWTVNIIHDAKHGRIPRPGPWWPGSAYVTWVGIDGYYYDSTRKFAPLFGPTIAAVRELTRDPILIAETAVAPTAGQPAKIADLFGGIRAYGLLGFVWFDAIGSRDWRLSSSAAISAFRQGAETYKRPAS